MIVVLEDMDVRVAWLRKRFPDETVLWARTVTDFKATLELALMRKTMPDLIILDHDLGEDSAATCSEVDGLCGMDAAKSLSVSCPVLVWSCNGGAAHLMIRELVNRGHRCKHIPFLEIMYPALVKYIASALEAA